MLVVLCELYVSGASAQQPEYQILSIGQIGESVSGGQAVSGNGLFGAGFSDAAALLWESNELITLLPPVPGRPISIPQSVNDQGTVAGIGATTFFGSSPLPVIWKDVVPFVDLITSGQFQAEGDINSDGVVDLSDVAPFVKLLSN